MIDVVDPFDGSLCIVLIGNRAFEGFDPKVVKVWYPNFDQYVKLHASWVEEWNKTYGYRQ